MRDYSEVAFRAADLRLNKYDLKDLWQKGSFTVYIVLTSLHFTFLLVNSKKNHEFSCSK